MAETAELLVARLRAGQQLEQVKSFLDLLARWRRDWQQTHPQALKFLQQSEHPEATNLTDLLQRDQDTLRQLEQLLTGHLRLLNDDLVKLSLVADRLEEGVRQARMLPLATLLPTLRRIVRDLAREKGVNVTFDISGADTEMDKHVLEQLKDPLIHLLRNCIDHGIEPPEQRSRRGKAARGTIALSAERLGNSILVQVTDDGAGIDIDAVRDAAIRRNLLSRDAAQSLSRYDLLALIFQPGLSTSPIITEVSGRGVGLDVVRRNVEALQGRVEVHSQPGQGTTFALTLPLTLISTHCLLVQAAGHTFALPLSTIERIIPVFPHDLTSLEGQPAISYQGRPLALVRLADVLQLPQAQPSIDPNGKAPAIILATAGQRITFLVDRLLDEQEVVVKNLGQQLARVPNVAGATILGTGQVVLILNVPDLVKSAQRAAGPQRPLVEAPSSPARKVILIVDDSITTRTLEKNILTTAGYEVKLAFDGQEALEALRQGPCDLVVSDIDMPHLDGFDLTEKLRQDERYQHLPVILVSSLNSPQDKARGIAVGADAYIVKSTFDQDNLLDTIRQLI
jgi:two-component system chemotaxis sensor kinase CheA